MDFSFLSKVTKQIALSGLAIGFSACLASGVMEQEIVEETNGNQPKLTSLVSILPSASTIRVANKQPTPLQLALIDGMLILIKEELFAAKLPMDNPILSNIKKEDPDSIAITANTYCSSFSENELKAEKEYVGKPLLVFGTMKSISRSIGTKEPELFLDSGPGCYSTIRASFMEPQKVTNALSELSTGSKVILQCQGSPKDSYLILSDCFLADRLLAKATAEVKEKFVEAATGEAYGSEEYAYAAILATLELSMNNEQKTVCLKNTSECLKDLDKLDPSKIAPELFINKLLEMGYTQEQMREMEKYFNKNK